MFSLLIPDYFVSMAVRGLVVGIGIGVVILALGFWKQKKSLGLYGFVASTIGGALLSGIFSLLLFLVFAWLILRGDSSVSEAAGEAAAAGEVAEGEEAGAEGMAEAE